MSTVHTTLAAAVLTGLAGTALGYGNLLALTWVQSRIPPELMGRVMSLLITGSVGLVPVSMFIAGAAVQVSVDATMLVAGVGWRCWLSARSSRRPSGTSGLEPPYQGPEAAGEASPPNATTEPAQA